MSKEKTGSVTDFVSEAKFIGDNATKPDAETVLDLGSVANATTQGKKKRGRPSKKTEQQNQENVVMYISTAKSINTVLFMAAHYISGTDEIIPDNKKADVMDSALASYLAHKEVAISPEMALFSVYAAWLGSSLQKPEVKKSITKKFASGFFGKLKSKFIKGEKDNESDDN